MMHTVRIYRFPHLSSTLFQRLKAAQMEAAQVWNRCCDLHKAARQSQTTAQYAAPADCQEAEYGSARNVGSRDIAT